ncbi:nucleoside hydrolase [Lactarius vividus]|nr:nucleoside hydrolase [Lactarius vividus]KAH9055517.1 nucleoside hydrolase [Lactarius vividus]
MRWLRDPLSINSTNTLLATSRHLELQRTVGMAINSSRIPVIIDTDPGVDDALAILLAIASPEIEILAFVVSFGNTDLEASYLNIFKIYQAVGRHIEQHPEERNLFPNYSPTRKPFVLRGAAGPLSGELHNATYFHGRDGLGEITHSHPEFNLPPDLFSVGVHPQLELNDRPGYHVALDLLRDNPPRSVTYIALGPLTNIAHMLRVDGTLVRERIGRVIIMGGAFDVPGNVTASAEFNFFADPFAVTEVLRSATTRLPLERVLLLPLDITCLHTLPFPAYSKYVDPAFAEDTPSVLAGKTPLTHFSSAFFRRTRHVMRARGQDGMELHDIAAVWAAITHPPGLEGAAPGWIVRQRRFDMERNGELTRGMCVVDRRDDNTRTPAANFARVQEALRHRVEAGSGDADVIGSVVVPTPVDVEGEPSLRRKVDEPGGVPVVESTPGPETLLQFLMKRVWNIEVTKESLTTDQLPVQ